MTIRTLSLSLFVGVLLLVSCKKSSDPVSPGDCNNATAMADKFTAAANAFAADPTNKTKCNAYVDAYKAYADAALACSSLYTQAQRDDIQASYNQAKDSCK
ncbi:hypothetical protein [Fibrivirga algicola]|uniref:Lipoprotein n=1 Tax=Fibrivirga algicola TaxID=2950420 RepID=A0ABX0QNY4_9BACT|nr:hypothetical protein [Fibrivirga algicola]NID12493.1 hypothetical protein [Fibrivirga algicola]